MLPTYTVHPEMLVNPAIDKDTYMDESKFLTLKGRIHVFVGSITACTIYGFLARKGIAFYPLFFAYILVASLSPIVGIWVLILSVFRDNLPLDNLLTSIGVNYDLDKLIPFNITLFLVGIIYIFKLNILQRCIEYCEITSHYESELTYNLYSLKPGSFSGANNLEKTPIICLEKKTDNFCIEEDDSDSGEENCFEQKNN
uniref:Uncharacterized protein n=1 Tax=Rhabditophanes sp. KR3021 TaxID=114890 RepID=A0AC35UIL1_9BILA